MSGVESWSDRIANVSPPTILLLVAALTTARLLVGRRCAVCVWARAVNDLCESLLLALVLVFLLLRPFVIQSFFIPSGSMQPTLCHGDRILVNKWVYRVRHPQCGEIVVFRAPREASPDERDYIKRLVGLPGDLIEVRAGFVQIDHDPFYTRSDVRAVLRASRETPLRLTTDAIWLGGHRFTPEEFARLAGRDGGHVRIVPGKVLRNREMLCETYVAEDPAYAWGPRRIPPGYLFVMGDNRNDSHDSHKWGPLPANRVIGRADWVFWPLARAHHIAP